MLETISSAYEVVITGNLGLIFDWIKSQQVSSMTQRLRWVNLERWNDSAQCVSFTEQSYGDEPDISILENRSTRDASALVNSCTAHLHCKYGYVYNMQIIFVLLLCTASVFESRVMLFLSRMLGSFLCKSLFMLSCSHVYLARVGLLNSVFTVG